MAYRILRADQVGEKLVAMAADNGLRRELAAVTKAFRLLSNNPRHPGLATHEFKGKACDHGKKLWQAYAQNRTPNAWRIWFCYCSPDGRSDPTIFVNAIGGHP